MGWRQSIYISTTCITPTARRRIIFRHHEHIVLNSYCIFCWIGISGHLVMWVDQMCIGFQIGVGLRQLTAMIYDAMLTIDCDDCPLLFGASRLLTLRSGSMKPTTLQNTLFQAANPSGPYFRFFPFIDNDMQTNELYDTGTARWQ